MILKMETFNILSEGVTDKLGNLAMLEPKSFLSSVLL
jgi:hypothetical protein